tara:strand:- start:54 stop:632 length:579 start_codon:yes stop_codon:yes gene_type:complete
MKTIKINDNYKKTAKLNKFASIICNDGECYLESEIGVAGIEISFTGKVQITPTLPEEFIMQGNNNKILIFSLQNNLLHSSLLFTYQGNIKITNLIVCNERGERLQEIFQKKDTSWDTLTYNVDIENIKWGEQKDNTKKGNVFQTKYNLPDYNLPKVDKTKTNVDKTKIKRRRRRATTSTYTGGSSSRGSGGY